ncbi:MAG: efflux RND transporter periplasmic adaptor subunit [Bryobacteraceae bacterium]|nr:efflux RND transporter periplasmic adaptor subunit [Bryobacteraceae bacterium]
MDVKREGVGRKKAIRRAILTILLLAAAGGITFALSRLKPAAPTKERATVWIDGVKRGPMVRQVRGLGTLIPEEILFIPAQHEGRVDKVVLRPGVNVKEDTVLLILSNPDMELQLADLEWQIKAAEANLADLRVKLETQKLALRSSSARVQSEFTQAKLTRDRDEALAKLNLKSDLELKLSVAKADELAGRLDIEKESLRIFEDSIRAQLDKEKVNIEKLRAARDLKKKQVDQLTIRSGTAGVLQQMAVEVGQRVTPGTLLAKVAQPWKLKAELKIAETQAKDIVIGQAAEIDTRNGIIKGQVSRIDPAVVNGTVTVDVRLVGELPQGARPDLSVDGTVELERLAEVVYVGRPVFGQAHSTVSLFRLDEDGKGATRVPVKLGRSSVNTIEIVEGLKVGDQVILSDMSDMDAHPRIRLN